LRRRRYCCEPGIPITFHGFFQAGQKQVKNRLVHLTKRGAVEHEAWALIAHAVLYLAQEAPSLVLARNFWKLLDGY
jgi:hypothetical protein